jgi:hypothetical protein
MLHSGRSRISWFRYPVNIYSSAVKSNWSVLSVGRLSTLISTAKSVVYPWKFELFLLVDIFSVAILRVRHPGESCSSTGLPSEMVWRKGVSELDQYWWPHSFSINADLVVNIWISYFYVTQGLSLSLLNIHFHIILKHMSHFRTHKTLQCEDSSYN